MATTNPFRVNTSGRLITHLHARTTKGAIPEPTQRPNPVKAAERDVQVPRLPVRVQLRHRDVLPPIAVTTAHLLAEKPPCGPDLLRTRKLSTLRERPQRVQAHAPHPVPDQRTAPPDRKNTSLPSIDRAPTTYSCRVVARRVGTTSTTGRPPSVATRPYAVHIPDNPQRPLRPAWCHPWTQPMIPHKRPIRRPLKIMCAFFKIRRACGAPSPTIRRRVVPLPHPPRRTLLTLLCVPSVVRHNKAARGAFSLSGRRSVANREHTALTIAHRCDVVNSGELARCEVLHHC